MRLPKGLDGRLVLAAVLVPVLFILDVQTPLGTGVWMLYLVPLVLATQAAGARTALAIATLCTALILAGLLLSPPGLPFATAVLNRGLAVSAVWLVTVLVVRHNRATAAQHASTEGTLRAIIDNAQVAMVLADPEGRVLMTNQLADRLYARPVPFGEPYDSHAQMQLLYPDGAPYRPRDLPLTRSALDGETFTGVDMIIEWPDGERRVLMINSAPIHDAQGHITGAVGAFQDITVRTEMEQTLAQTAAELRQARDELELRVGKRTAELQQANQALQAEIQARQSMEEMLRANREQLQLLSRRLVEALENERRAIARELHDVSGQALSALLINTGLLQRRKDCSDEMRVRLAELSEQIEAVAQELHSLSWNLRPVSLDKLGLPSALRQLVENFQKQYGMAVEFESVGLQGADRLPPEAETVLYRIIQEALTNVARHAKARSVGVVVQCSAGNALAIVEDDGCGFDVKEAEKRGRLGLLGMRERAEMLGGTLRIESSAEGGTAVVATIPVGNGMQQGE